MALKDTNIVFMDANMNYSEGSLWKQLLVKYHSWKNISCSQYFTAENRASYNSLINMQVVYIGQGVHAQAKCLIGSQTRSQTPLYKLQDILSESSINAQVDII